MTQKIVDAINITTAILIGILIAITIVLFAVGWMFGCAGVFYE